ncbi:MAG: hypothetical protein P9M00_06265 [Candidatus Tritonobacter lacicola]|nr:hypothetical protein [Candidatus Tritonobacter lacicola]
MSGTITKITSQTPTTCAEGSIIGTRRPVCRPARRRLRGAEDLS